MIFGLLAFFLRPLCFGTDAKIGSSESTILEGDESKNLFTAWMPIREPISIATPKA